MCSGAANTGPAALPPVKNQPQMFLDVGMFGERLRAGAVGNEPQSPLR